MTLSNISLELGHFYEEAYAEGAHAMAKRFEAAKLLAAAALWSRSVKASTTAVSTCFLLEPLAEEPPKKVFEQIIASAVVAAVGIDYIAREAAYSDVALASLGLAEGHIAQGELYDLPQSTANKPLFSAAYLASLWQTHRNGGLPGLHFPEPQPVDNKKLPDWNQWSDVPALVQLNPNANPFQAEHQISILPNRFLDVEAAAGRIIPVLSKAALTPIAWHERVTYVFSSDV
ncbi:MAG TPA: hypothetical protein VLE73_03780 [Candidatus Saccharimonadales bacterium]|nr:hypothetical protein [Candidatus Saccharimonadales bacterium]